MQSILLLSALACITFLLSLSIYDRLGLEQREVFGMYFARLYCLSISSGCIFLFVASLNTLLHFLGYSLGGLEVFVLASLAIWFLLWDNRHKLGSTESLLLLNKLKPRIALRDSIGWCRRSYPGPQKWIACTALLILLFLAISYLYRLTLPIGHQDQLNQYLYDSLQIASLQSLSLPEYYNLGQAFRSDSFASFFDAFFIQSVGGWQITILIRLYMLILAAAMCSVVVYRFSRSYLAPLLFILIVFSLPDLWSIGLSGKHDTYLVFMEVAIFFTALLSFIGSKASSSLGLAALAVIFQLASVASRLSSAALMLVLLPVLAVSIGRVFAHSLGTVFPLSEIRIKYSSRTLLLIGFVILVAFSAGILPLLNWIYLDNPFYRLSPPGFLSQFFSSNNFISDYDQFKDAYNLQIKLPVVSSVFTAFYAAFGLEVVRFGSRQISASLPVLRHVYEWLSLIGPRDLMISLFSLSPAVFLPIVFFRRQRSVHLRLVVIFLYAWMYVWTIGIAYSRVFMAGTMLLVGVGLICCWSYFKDGQSKYLAATSWRSFASAPQLFLLLLSVMYSLVFSLWAVTHTLDLKSANGFTFDRDQAVIRFLDMTSSDGVSLFGAKPWDIPSKSFRDEWKSILDREPSFLHILKDSPSHVAYLADNALIAGREVRVYTPHSYPSGVKCYAYLSGSIAETRCN